MTQLNIFLHLFRFSRFFHFSHFCMSSVFSKMQYHFYDYNLNLQGEYYCYKKGQHRLVAFSSLLSLVFVNHMQWDTYVKPRLTKILFWMLWAMWMYHACYPCTMNFLFLFLHFVPCIKILRVSFFVWPLLIIEYCRLFIHRKIPMWRSTTMPSIKFFATFMKNNFHIDQSWLRLWLRQHVRSIFLSPRRGCWSAFG